jgi:hypothetical protein
MFDSIVIARIVEMQNAADRRRWQQNEDAFYRDLSCPFWHRCTHLWLLSIRALRQRKAAGSSLNDAPAAMFAEMDVIRPRGCSAAPHRCRS